MNRLYVLFACLLSGLYGYNANAQAPAINFGLKSGGVTTRVSGSHRSVLKTNGLTDHTPPNIAYPSPQVYAINQPIPQLTPVNGGGVVPPAIYNQVSTVFGPNSLVGEPSGVVTDAAGNCYFTNYDVYPVKVTPSGIATPLGQIESPASLTIDSQNNLFVTDFNDGRIYKITPDGTKSVFAGNYTGSADGTGTAAQFDDPCGICIDKQDNIYVLDRGSGQIRKITPNAVVTTLSLSGNTNFTGSDGLNIDAGDNIYVAASKSNLIYKITPAGVVSIFAGNGVAASTDGVGTSASFNYPTGISIDSEGDLYVSDYKGLVIRKVTPAGVVTTIAGSGNNGTNNGIGRAASFAGPFDTALDAGGNILYITDFDGSVVKKMALSGYTIDKALPPGLSFDPKIGIISGTPTALWPPTNYTITAYNGAGSSSFIVNISVAATAVISTVLPSIINLPPQQPNMLTDSNYFNPEATSTNSQTPITYTTSDPSVAYITPDGRIKVIAPGVIILTAYQAGNDQFTPAVPVSEQVSFLEYLNVYLPPITDKSLCTADFSAGGLVGDKKFPVAYTSSNINVATIDNNGMVHITGPGTTTITLSQAGQLPLYIAATPMSQTFTVSQPVIPTLSITADHDNSCEGSPITFTAAAENEGAQPMYQWHVNNINAGTNSTVFTSSILKNGDEVTCTVINDDNSCIMAYPGKSNAITVNRIPSTNPAITISASVSAIIKGTSITFSSDVTDAGTNLSYQWYVNGKPEGTNSPTFSSDAFNNNDLVVCVVSPTAACSTPATSNQVKLIVVDKVVIPNTFTPNGDGINEEWNISGIGSYPDCSVNIYTRYGQLIYHSKGYQNAWNGTINGAAAPASTYYYVIDLGFKHIVMSGFVMVMR